MKLFPYERLSIISSYPPIRISEIITNYIEPMRWCELFWSFSSKPYHGTISKNNFQLWRVLHSANSFIPIVYGEIKPSDKGSVVYITIRPFWGAFGLMILLFLIAIVVSIGLAINYLQVLIYGGVINQFGYLIGLSVIGFLLFFDFVAWLTFTIESERTKEFLYKVLLPE